MASVGSSIIAKGAIAVALAFLLYYYRQKRALWILNGFLACVVLWNLAICFLMDSVPSGYAVFGFQFFG
jgi:hypothetical protein